MARSKYSKKVRDAAATLITLVDNPKYAGTQWTWDDIGHLLGLNQAQSRKVIYYLREHHDDFVWTVGTYSTDYKSMPTTSSIDALPGLINQYRHSLTRERSSQKVWETLAKVDPDPRWSKFAAREARWWERKADDTRDHLEHLVDEWGGGGAGPSAAAV